MLAAVRPQTFDYGLIALDGYVLNADRRTETYASRNRKYEADF